MMCSEILGEKQLEVMLFVCVGGVCARAQLQVMIINQKNK